jgi:AcrR family transcriptional regulator
MAMKPTPRMNFDDRKCQILSAVRKLFGQKGLGATTKELAQAAGVSEALLFKHFPSKEALHEAVVGQCEQSYCSSLEKMKHLEASTAALVLIIYHMVRSALAKPSEVDSVLRIYARSLAEDGEFARLITTKVPEYTMKKIQECIEAATKSGDMVSKDSSKLRAWFAERVGFTLLLDLLPQPPAVDYGVSPEKLLEPAVLFILRGIGLKEEAIHKYYNPKALALLQS